MDTKNITKSSNLHQVNPRRPRIILINYNNRMSVYQQIKTVNPVYFAKYPVKARCLTIFFTVITYLLVTFIYFILISLIIVKLPVRLLSNIGRALRKLF
jgi:hypothetical protein